MDTGYGYGKKGRINRRNHRISQPAGYRAERERRRAVDHELQVDMMVRQLDEVGLVEHAVELPRKVRRILGADAEGDEGTDVAKDSVPDVGGELVQILMADGEPEPVLAHLGEHVGKRERREALELVDIHEEVPALGGIEFRRGCSRRARSS